MHNCGKKYWNSWATRKNLEEAVESKLEELRRQEVGAQSEIERLNNELDKVMDERQWVITKARKGTLNESDMDIS